MPPTDGGATATSPRERAHAIPGVRARRTTRPSVPTVSVDSTSPTAGVAPCDACGPACACGPCQSAHGHDHAHAGDAAVGAALERPMVDPPMPVRPTGAPSVALTLPRVPRVAFGQFLPTGRLRPSGDPVPPAAVAMGYTQDAWDHLLPGLQQMYRNAPAPQTTPGSQPAGARPSTPVPAALEGRVSQQTWDEASDAQRTAMLAAAGPSSASVAWQTVGQGLGTLGTTIAAIINSGNQREVDLARIASGDNNAAAQRDLQMRALEVQQAIAQINAESNTTNATQLAPLMSLLQQQAASIASLQAQAQQPPASTGMSTGAIVGLAVGGAVVVGGVVFVAMRQMGRGRDGYRPNPSCSCSSRNGTRSNPCACASRKNPSARRHHGIFRGHAERVRRSPGAFL